MAIWRPEPPYLWLYNHKIPSCFYKRDLRVLHGIGKVKITLLHNRGIYTVDQLIFRLITEEKYHKVPAEKWLHAALEYRTGRIRTQSAILQIRAEQNYEEDGFDLVNGMSALTIT